MYGHFELRTPSYVLKGLDVIKKVAVKDFDYFMDRRSIISAECDPLLGNALILLTGQKWKDMRATLSPAFTGSKMRNMFSLVTDCTKQSIATIKSQLKGEEMTDMKEFFSKFTVDTIATCAFGIEVNSFKDPENDFQKVANGINNNSGFVTGLKFLGMSLFPKFMETFKITFFAKEVTSFFRKAVHETMSIREKQGIVRPDMINLLLQAKKGLLLILIKFLSTYQFLSGFSTL